MQSPPDAHDFGFDRGHAQAVDLQELLDLDQRMAQVSAVTGDVRQPVRLRGQSCVAGNGGCRHAVGGGSALESRDIGAARQNDPKRIVAAGACIITRQGSAQPAGFHPHDRIALRVEVAAAAERGDGDRVRLDAVAVARKLRFDHKAEKPRQPHRGAKAGAGDDAVELPAHFIGLPAFSRAFARIYAVVACP